MFHQSLNSKWSVYIQLQVITLIFPNLGQHLYSYSDLLTFKALVTSPPSVNFSYTTTHMFLEEKQKKSERKESKRGYIEYPQINQTHQHQIYIGAKSANAYDDTIIFSYFLMMSMLGNRPEHGRESVTKWM